MTLIEDLRRFSIFHSLDEQALQIFARCAQRRTANQGDYLVREGQPAEHCYGLLEGRMAIELELPQRPAMTIMTVKPGQVAGWSWMFPPFQWSANIRALDDLSYISLEGSCLRQYCDSHPEHGYLIMKHFAKLISQRLEATRIQLLDVYGRYDQGQKESIDESS